MSDLPKATIDLESFYDKNVTVAEQGNDNYFREADVYLVSIATDDLQFAGSVADVERELGTRWMDNYQPQAFNSNFDQTGWEKHFPAFKHPWHCVSDACAVNQLPRDLARASKVVLKEDKSKAIRAEMKGIRFEDLPEEKQQEVVDYGLDDAVREHRMGPLVKMSDFESAVAEHTRRINRRGVQVDMDLLETSVRTLEDASFGVTKQIPWRQNAALLSPKAFAAFCSNLGLTAPGSRDKKDLEFLAFVKAHPEVAEVVEAMQTHTSINRLLKKYAGVKRRVREDGTMPIELMYCGAPHTRRWSSRGINVQNLDRKPTDLSKWLPESHPPSERSVYMRNLIIPRPGKILAALDLAQIEPRSLAWLVGDEDLLNAVRAGFGVYEAYARAKLKWRGGELKSEDPAFYQRTKNNFLGSGYGMGGDKLFATNPGTFDDVAEAVRTVKAYRADNPKVTAFWRYFDGLIKQTAVNKDTTLEITMPTGETLRHFFVRPMGGGKRGIHSYTVKGAFDETAHIYNLWGGVMTENVTQRFARDVLATQLLRLDRAGFDVLFSAHDEVVLELDIDNAKDAFREAEHLMTISPDWAPDLPLGAEGKIIDRYTKI